VCSHECSQSAALLRMSVYRWPHLDRHRHPVAVGVQFGAAAPPVTDVQGQVVTACLARRPGSPAEEVP
jgi:hypothetical protein